MGLVRRHTHTHHTHTNSVCKLQPEHPQINSAFPVFSSEDTIDFIIQREGHSVLGAACLHSQGGVHLISPTPSSSLKRPSRVMSAKVGPYLTFGYTPPATWCRYTKTNKCRAIYRASSIFLRGGGGGNGRIQEFLKGGGGGKSSSVGMFKLTRKTPWG